MRFQRIHEAINHQPWFISPQGYSSIRAIFETASNRPAGAKEDLDEALADFIRARPDIAFDVPTRTARIHIFGLVGPHLSVMEKSCGNTSYQDIVSEIEQAKSLGAERINFIFDSPGGVSMGCHEAAVAIAALRDETSIFTVAFTDGVMCSGAYYLASGCNAIIATESAVVGNIGVILPWADKSAMWAELGLDFQPITSEGADLKGTLHGPSLTESQRSFLQEGVNQIGAMFKNHVAENRGLALSDEVWRAGWYGGSDAVTLGLADLVADSAEAI